MSPASSLPPPRPWRRAAAIASRVAAALAGGWLFAAGFVVLCIALGRCAGMAYADAQTLSWLLVFLLWVAVVCWAFSAASTAKVWGVLVGGGLAMGAAGWCLMGAVA